MNKNNKDKKGQIGDLFDLFYLVGGTVIILVVAGLALNSGIARNNQISLSELGDFNRMDSAINNLKVSLTEGKEIKLEEVEDLIKRSKVLRGKTITSCFDYEQELDCGNDPVKVSGTKSCLWFRERCMEVDEGIKIK